MAPAWEMQTMARWPDQYQERMMSPQLQGLTCCTETTLAEKLVFQDALCDFVWKKASKAG
jgi:hypothetical protein